MSRDEYFQNSSIFRWTTPAYGDPDRYWCRVAAFFAFNFPFECQVRMNLDADDRITGLINLYFATCCAADLQQMAQPADFVIHYDSISETDYELCAIHSRPPALRINVGGSRADLYSWYGKLTLRHGPRLC